MASYPSFPQELLSHQNKRLCFVIFVNVTLDSFICQKYSATFLKTSFVFTRPNIKYLI